MSDGFLSRWSRRKLELRGTVPVAPPGATPAIALPESAKLAQAGQPDALAGTQPIAHAPADNPAPVPHDVPPELPTLADAQRLTPDSDFKPFMARGVASKVKNAAMKKLFADPHYNVMDRLDTYIDDYSLPDPIPEALLRQMVSAKFLNLFSEPDNHEIGATGLPMADIARDDTDTPAPEMVAQSQTTLEPQQDISPPPDQAAASISAPDQQASQADYDHTDLRLQPDHAAATKGAGRGTA